jgi:hypothetical protein
MGIWQRSTQSLWALLDDLFWSVRANEYRDDPGDTAFAFFTGLFNVILILFFVLAGVLVPINKFIRFCILRLWGSDFLWTDSGKSGFAVIATPALILSVYFALRRYWQYRQELQKTIASYKADRIIAAIPGTVLLISAIGFYALMCVIFW